MAVVKEFKVAWQNPEKPLVLRSKMFSDSVKAKRFGRALEKSGSNVTLMSKTWNNNKGDYTWRMQKEFSGKYVNYTPMLLNPLTWVVGALLAFSVGRSLK